MKNVNRSENDFINIQELFRLPWTMSDNGITWLEPTRQCNITCDACFQFNDPMSRKSLNQIEAEIKVLLKLRRCDAMLIAGGEPLTHPDIIEVTKIVKSYNVKPVLLTNGVALKPELLSELKKAGLSGVSFHVDSHQSRPDWTGKNENELNALRQYFADMVYKEKGLSCSFILTIFPDTIHEMPYVVKRALKNVHKVGVVTFSLVRTISKNDRWNYFNGTEKIDIDETPYSSDKYIENLMTTDMYREIRKVLPDFVFNSYLGGTVLPNSLKWTLGSHISSRNKTFGYTSGKIMELVQNIHHLFTGKFLAYTEPHITSRGKSMLIFGLFDYKMRMTSKKYFISVLKNPLMLFRKLYLQSFTVVQPVDILPNGENDNCDGCPNKTLWKGQLISACRLEEFMKYGAPMMTLPKKTFKEYSN